MTGMLGEDEAARLCDFDERRGCDGLKAGDLRRSLITSASRQQERDDHKADRVQAELNSVPFRLDDHGSVPRPIGWRLAWQVRRISVDVQSLHRFGKGGVIRLQLCD